MSSRLLLLMRRRGGGVSVVTDGLIAEYRYDDGSGQVVTDYVGGANLQLGSTSGADTNDGTWETAGLTLTTDDNCRNATAPVVSQPNTHVICFNFKTQLAGTGYIIDGVAARQIIQWNTGDRVGLYAGSGPIYSTNDSGTFPKNRWVILTAIYNGASSTAYKGTTVIPGLEAINPGALGLTGLFVGSSNGGSLFTESTFGYHMIYNKVLSTDEIAQNVTALTAIMSVRGVTIP